MNTNMEAKHRSGTDTVPASRSSSFDSTVDGASKPADMSLRISPLIQKFAEFGVSPPQTAAVTAGSATQAPQNSAVSGSGSAIAKAYQDALSILEIDGSSGVHNEGRSDRPTAQQLLMQARRRSREAQQPTAGGAGAMPVAAPTASSGPVLLGMASMYSIGGSDEGTAGPGQPAEGSRGQTPAQAGPSASSASTAGHATVADVMGPADFSDDDDDDDDDEQDTSDFKPMWSSRDVLGSIRRDSVRSLGSVHSAVAAATAAVTPSLTSGLTSGLASGLTSGLASAASAAASLLAPVAAAMTEQDDSRDWAEVHGSATAAAAANGQVTRQGSSAALVEASPQPQPQATVDLWSSPTIPAPAQPSLTSDSTVEGVMSGPAFVLPSMTTADNEEQDRHSTGHGHDDDDGPGFGDDEESGDEAYDLPLADVADAFPSLASLLHDGDNDSSHNVGLGQQQSTRPSGLETQPTVHAEGAGSQPVQPDTRPSTPSRGPVAAPATTAPSTPVSAAQQAGPAKALSPNPDIGSALSLLKQKGKEGALVTAGAGQRTLSPPRPGAGAAVPTAPPQAADGMTDDHARGMACTWMDGEASEACEPSGQPSSTHPSSLAHSFQAGRRKLSVGGHGHVHGSMDVLDAQEGQHGGPSGAPIQQPQQVPLPALGPSTSLRHAVGMRAVTDSGTPGQASSGLPMSGAAARGPAPPPVLQRSESLPSTHEYVLGPYEAGHDEVEQAHDLSLGQWAPVQPSAPPPAAVVTAVPPAAPARAIVTALVALPVSVARKPSPAVFEGPIDGPSRPRLVSSSTVRMAQAMAGRAAAVPGAAVRRAVPVPAMTVPISAPVRAVAPAPSAPTATPSATDHEEQGAEQGQYAQATFAGRQGELQGGQVWLASGDRQQYEQPQYQSSTSQVPPVNHAPSLAQQTRTPTAPPWEGQGQAQAAVVSIPQRAQMPQAVPTALPTSASSAVAVPQPHPQPQPRLPPGVVMSLVEARAGIVRVASPGTANVRFHPELPGHQTQAQAQGRPVYGQVEEVSVQAAISRPTSSPNSRHISPAQVVATGMSTVRAQVVVPSPVPQYQALQAPSVSRAVVVSALVPASGQVPSQARRVDRAPHTGPYEPSLPPPLNQPPEPFLSTDAASFSSASVGQGRRSARGSFSFSSAVTADLSRRSTLAGVAGTPQPHMHKGGQFLPISFEVPAPVPAHADRHSLAPQPEPVQANASGMHRGASRPPSTSQSPVLPASVVQELPMVAGGGNSGSVGHVEDDHNGDAADGAGLPAAVSSPRGPQQEWPVIATPPGQGLMQSPSVIPSPSSQPPAVANSPSVAHPPPSAGPSVAQSALLRHLKESIAITESLLSPQQAAQAHGHGRTGGRGAADRPAILDGVDGSDSPVRPSSALVALAASPGSVATRSPGRDLVVSPPGKTGTAASPPTAVPSDDSVVRVPASLLQALMRGQLPGLDLADAPSSSKGTGHPDKDKEGKTPNRGPVAWPHPLRAALSPSTGDGPIEVSVLLRHLEPEGRDSGEDDEEDGSRHGGHDDEEGEDGPSRSPSPTSLGYLSLETDGIPDLSVALAAVLGPAGPKEHAGAKQQPRAPEGQRPAAAIVSGVQSRGAATGTSALAAQEQPAQPMPQLTMGTSSHAAATNSSAAADAVSKAQAASKQQAAAMALSQGRSADGSRAPSRAGRARDSTTDAQPLSARSGGGSASSTVGPAASGRSVGTTARRRASGVRHSTGLPYTSLTQTAAETAAMMQFAEVLQVLLTEPETGGGTSVGARGATVGQIGPASNGMSRVTSPVIIRTEAPAARASQRSAPITRDRAWVPPGGTSPGLSPTRPVARPRSRSPRKVENGSHIAAATSPLQGLTGPLATSTATSPGTASLAAALEHMVSLGLPLDSVTRLVGAAVGAIDVDTGMEVATAGAGAGQAQDSTRRPSVVVPYDTHAGPALATGINSQGAAASSSGGVAQASGGLFTSSVRAALGSKTGGPVKATVPLEGSTSHSAGDAIDTSDPVAWRRNVVVPPLPTSAGTGGHRASPSSRVPWPGQSLASSGSPPWGPLGPLGASSVGAAPRSLASSSSAALAAGHGPRRGEVLQFFEQALASRGSLSSVGYRQAEAASAVGIPSSGHMSYNSYSSLAASNANNGSSLAASSSTVGSLAASSTSFISPLRVKLTLPELPAGLRGL